MRLRNFLLLPAFVTALALLLLQSSARADGPEPVFLGRLAADEQIAQAYLDTPEGRAEIIMQGTVPRPFPHSDPATRPGGGGDLTAATTYTRTCSAWVQDATGLLWKLKLNSTFFYNYSTLWQNPPWLDVRAVFLYSWSDLRAWNSYWSYTVRFADGAGVLHTNYPWPNFSRWTKHVWIQEDAWGNCTFFSSG